MPRRFHVGANDQTQSTVDNQISADTLSLINVITSIVTIVSHLSNESPCANTNRSIQLSDSEQQWW